MQIDYFIRQEDESDEFLAFESVHSSDFFKEQHEKMGKGVLLTSLSKLDESIAPFLANEYVFTQLKTHDLASLPIVLVDGKVFSSGRMPTVAELSELLDIGIAIQRVK